jgi:hypothetical protein
MNASSQTKGKLFVEYLYGTCPKTGSNILGRRIWRSDMSMCMYDIERMQAMSLHDACLG